MKTSIGRIVAGAIAGLGLSIAASAAPAEKLPPCVPDKPIPPGGCMAPKDPVTPLDNLKPAPPLKVPPSGELRPAPPLTVPPPILPIPPAAPPVNPSGSDSPAVVKPPPTGDSDIVKRPPEADSKMPVIKPPQNPQPRTAP